MPLPIHQVPDPVSEAVESALIKTGVISSRDSAVEALNASGADLDSLMCELANLARSGRDGVKLQAIIKAANIHGINFEVEGGQRAIPQITIQVVSEGNTNLNNVFAPERKF